MLAPTTCSSIKNALLPSDGRSTRKPLSPLQKTSRRYDPDSRLDNLIREEITLAAFYIWILILACIGLAKTSIPHLIAVTLSLTLSSLWIGVEIHQTRAFWASFLRTTTTRCAGANVIPSYWAWRMGFQVSSLLLNLFLLGASGWLSWRLRDHFGWETFQRIGASRAMKRMYSLVLAMSIILQLDAFVLITFFALWLAQVSHPHMPRHESMEYENIRADERSRMA